MLALRDVALAYLNDTVLATSGWTPLRDGFDLLADDWPTIPVSRGTYVLLAPARLFIYPGGGSAVFYVGKASSLPDRLREHKRYSLHVRAGVEGRYYPRYEWAGSLGANACFSTPRSKAAKDISEKEMEEPMLSAFGRASRAIPLANGGGGWSLGDCCKGSP
jgi:hypothetical protein